MTVLFAGIGYHAIAWQPPALWIDHLGTGVVTNVVADSNGAYAGGSVGANLFMSRYDLGGHLVWSRDFGNSTIDEIQGIALGTDGVYTAGSLNNTGFVRKYDPNGTVLWTNRYGGLFSNPYASLNAGTGRVFVSYANKPSNSTLLGAYDPSGNPLWTDSLGYTNVISMATYSGDSRVNVIGSGPSYFLRSYNSDGTLNWKENFSCSCVPSGVAADASGIYVVEYSFQGGIGIGSIGTLVKYDSSGSQLWTRNFASPDATTVGTPRISVDSSGIYLAITTSFSGFLMKYDRNGNQVWAVQAPVSASSVSVGQDGVYVGGEASNNALLAKYAQSSSLVLFGVNPPFSFGLVSLLGGVVVLSLFWLRRQRKRHVRRPRSAVPNSPPKLGEDDSKWVRRPP